MNKQPPVGLARETAKTFRIFIIDDTHVEGTETVNLVLSSPTNNAILGAQSIVALSIADNDTVVSGVNPIDRVEFFVRQQYVDFLIREPDLVGNTEWQRVLNTCTNQGGLGADPACDRVHVSSGFFRSPEFQGRGYFVYRFYETSFGRRPQYAEFIPDMQRVSGSQTLEQEEASKQAFVRDFMARADFRSQYDNLSNVGFVDELICIAGVTLANRNELVADLEANRRTRAEILRAVVESQAVYVRFYNRAFVAMQYFGYLRRDPDEAGYAEWVRVLDTTGDFRHMIFGFIYSTEYRGRFAQP